MGENLGGKKKYSYLFIIIIIIILIVIIIIIILIVIALFFKKTEITVEGNKEKKIIYSKNQSIVQQFTSDGNILTLFLN